MKALCHPYWSWLKGFIRSRLADCLHTFLVTIPSHFSVMGLLVLNHLVSLRIVSPGYGFAHAIDGCVVGYDGYYAKGLSLKLIAISWLCLYQHYSG
jgi:hypothetical protein